MSEEILKALMELFALVAKQDGGVIVSEREYVYNVLRKELSAESVNEYLALFDQHAGPVRLSSDEKELASPSVRDSVQILGICRKINRTLNQEQKVVVAMRLYEMVNADRRFTPQRMNIINTVAEVFKIPSDEFKIIEQFVNNDDPEKINSPAIITLKPGEEECGLCNKTYSGYPDTKIFFLQVASVNLFFVKYISADQLYLNGLPIMSGQVYSFAKGGSIKSRQGHAVYYSDINARFLSHVTPHKLSFTVENLSHVFPNGQTALNNLSFSTDQGKLVGILGATGSGKTTLLNLISGIVEPTTGTIKINGLDIFKEKDYLEGVIGFVPQDDLLIEDLTVFENLYFSACQSFGNKNKTEITSLVDQVLSNLGLIEKKNLKVGSQFNKVISGGQRKKLNIALELIREPSVLFLDEPTSGLSSRDSENLMDLLRDLTLKGKLIITVIHQPSSEIFKMFDNVIILDYGGYMVYSGNPVDAVIYFKTLDNQINANQGECPSCGNVNPDTIFNILETQVVDEFGRYTEKRKVKPEDWGKRFRSLHTETQVAHVNEPPQKTLIRPLWLKQSRIYFSRDLKSKTANTQYVLLTLLEAPILGFILSFIIRYIPDPASHEYVFAENENIPIYIFMSIIVALFLGLTISAEEIFRDRKMLAREHFLNLSRNSYLVSKITILVIISAIQTFLFLIIANPILGIRGMLFSYWISLFITALYANMLGLIISSSFNSAITIYIIIPLLIIPMMVLSGAMFPFDKLNRYIGSVNKVPVIAELMPTRWTYEAMMVTQFKGNKYSTVVYNEDGETYFMLQKELSEADFNKVYRVPELKRALASILSNYSTNQSNQADDNRTAQDRLSSNLHLLRNELSVLPSLYDLSEFKFAGDLTTSGFNQVIADSLALYLEMINEEFRQRSTLVSDTKERFYNLNEAKLKKLEKKYFNYKLEEIVTKYYEPNKFFVYKDIIIQNTDPVYLDPPRKGFLNFRTHFFAPSKYIFGIKTDTFVFNNLLVLLSTIILYVCLYFDLLAKAVRFGEKLGFRK